jgi:uncharacterized protein YlxW (UPF0749 family)
MTLLTEVMTRPLDPGYAAAAERRAERLRTGQLDGQQADGDRGAETGRTGRSPLAVVVLVVVGLLLAVAFLQARGSRPAGVRQRAALVREIEREAATVDRLQRSNAAALTALEAERGRRLDAQAQGALVDRVSALGVLTGAVPVTGPGLELTVDDAPQVADAGDDSDPRAADEADDGRVLDQDLQLVVNGLWAAGAEAVSINGERLTALSAIRSAGQAVLVDYRPLSPPYRIRAVGDPTALRSRFTAGPGGREVRYLRDTFGVRVATATSQRLTLPASSAVVTRRAKAVGVVPGSGPASGPATTRPRASTSSRSSTTSSTTSSNQDTP